MNKKQIKKYIIVTLIVFLILLMIIILIKHKEQNKAEVHEIERIEEVGLEENKIKQETTRDRYFLVKRCITQYNNSIKYYYGNNSRVLLDSELEEETKKYYTSSLYNMLSEEYIIENSITEANIYDVVTGGEMHINKLYSEELNENITAFIVYGKLKSYKDNKFYDYGYIINIDFNNTTFEIYPYEYMIKYNMTDISKRNSININKETIKKNTNNIVVFKITTDEEMAKEYFDIYKYLLVNDKEGLYDTLDEEYRENRYKSEEDFMDFIDNSFNTMVASIIDEYSVEYDVDYSYYIIKDKKENYYIFKTSAVMEYTLYLDNHTIDLPQFTEKYNSSSTENKVAMNIEKVKDAINTKDYEYIYEKLDSTFKNNNYPNLESFTSYIQNNLYEKNIFAYRNIEEQNDIYFFKVEVSDMEDKNLEIKTINIVMKLNEGTDFTMSFNVNE